MLLKLSYITLTLVMTLFVFAIGSITINNTFIDKAKAKRKKIMLVSGLLLWHMYIFIMASSGVLETFELPPRFPLLIIFPVFLFTGIFLYKNKNNAWINQLSLKTLTYVQVFRVAVEIIFVFSISAGILHKNVTIEGYNFDMVFAVTAPILAVLVFNKKMIKEKIILWWNYLGLAVLASVIFVFITSTYFPNIYASEASLLSIEFTKYPYILVAGFLMPLAVFLHVLSIVVIKKKV
jgi:hypothetical protein